MLAGAYKHEITYWAPNPLDGFGLRTFLEPILFRGRWEDRTDLNIGSTQEFKPSRARVYSPQALALGGYLARGDYTDVEDPTSLANAYQIQSYSEIPALSGSGVLRKALL